MHASSLSSLHPRAGSAENIAPVRKVWRNFAVLTLKSLHKARNAGTARERADAEVLGGCGS